MDLNAECKRKSELLDLFWDLQESERREMINAKRKNPWLKYERMFRGLAFIDKIHPSTLRLIRDNGKVVKALEVTPEIAKLVNEKDHFFMIAGRRAGLWRLISMEGIGTEVSGGPGEQPQIHFSAMNPFKTSADRTH